MDKKVKKKNEIKKKSFTADWEQATQSKFSRASLMSLDT